MKKFQKKLMGRSAPPSNDIHENSESVSYDVVKINKVGHRPILPSSPPPPRHAAARSTPPVPPLTPVVVPPICPSPSLSHPPRSTASARRAS